MEIKMVRFFKILRVLPVVSFFCIWFTGCRDNSIRLVSVQEQSAAGNVLMKTIEVVCNKNAGIFIRYWEKANPEKSFVTVVSSGKKVHRFPLLLLKPAATYQYAVVTRTDKITRTLGEVRTFQTGELPMGIQEMVMPAEIQDPLPEAFAKGYTLIARRDLPGQMYLVNAKGQIVWYHTIKDAGFKVAHFTKQATLLTLVAPLSYPTSYGNEILEVSLAGDTVFHLKKGEKGFDKTIHHELFYNDQHQLVTLTLEKEVLDLSKAGGTKADTVTGDGILILDHKGNKVWEWSVFDVLDPLTDPQILNDRTDWLHANSLSVDTDGNYLLSFYLSGQLWKIDAKAGNVIWKLGRNGEYTFPRGGAFHESHAAYRNPRNQLMLFENGTDQQRSRVLTYTLDEQGHKAYLNRSIELPRHLYSERMGSAYWINDSSTLVCSAQANSVSLVNNRGAVLWRIRTGFAPYRAVFIDHLPLPYF
ncbi:MAG: aryl-sulfate sulfotransferase [Niabella sp.]|nr:aryl-sulfate sulfotransferase [Niabella sp.]